MYRTAPLAVLALLLASCGGGGPSTTTTHPTSRSTTTARQVKVAPKTKVRQKTHVDSAACEARLNDLLARMGDLRQALLAGLSYPEYVVRVQAIHAAYEAVPVDRLGLSCLAGPAGDAEDAFNQYLRAANVWGECAGTAGCAASSIEGRLQHRWRIASERLDAAKRPG